MGGESRRRLRFLGIGSGGRDLDDLLHFVLSELSAGPSRRRWSGLAGNSKQGAETAAGGNANFILGSRGLDGDFWGETDSQGVFGVQVDFGPDKWPVKVALGLSVSAAESDDFGCVFCGIDDHDGPILGARSLTSGVFEFSSGVLYQPRKERMTRPYVGGGLAFIGAGQEVSRGLVVVDDDDTTVGFYVNGGVTWRLGKRFNIGVDARVVTGTSLELFGKKGDANYGQLGLVLGWGW